MKMKSLLTADMRVLAGSLIFASVIAIGGIGITFGSGGCQVPNPNTVLCKEVPDDAVDSCTSVSQTECTNFRIYEIENFPVDPPLEADEGTTAEVQANCIRSRRCVIDLSQSPAACISDTDWGAWTQAAKTVEGTNPCP